MNLKTIVSVIVGGYLLGTLLDEAGRGTFGSFVKTAALKATRGFGTAA